MSRSDTLPIFLETYKLLQEVYRVTTLFPREHKFSLGQDIRKDALALFRCIYNANHHTDKVQYLEDFLADFEMLRLEFRLCADLNILSLKKLVHLSLMMDGIGKQATAWKKHQQTQQRKKESKSSCDKEVCQNQDQ